MKVIGEEAHIRARSAGGPRYDREYVDVDGYDNLVLMCPTHHTMIDTMGGAGYTVEALIEIKKRHEKNQSRRAELERTLRAYLGDRFAAEGSVQFQQVDLRGPSVDAMFVDVPVGSRRDGSELAKLLGEIAASAPGDTETLERDSGLVVTGAAQALLHPDWKGHAVLVGGPGQGKSTVLQYVCQFHRARKLGEDGYTAGPTELVRMRATSRFPLRVELRRYAEWATQSPSPLAPKKKRKNQESTNLADNWRSLEEYVIEDIRRHIGANEFSARDLALLLATEPVLLALDGLDEVASLPTRERVVSEITQMRGRLKADAADLMILVATRPGTSLQPLTASNAFPVLHLQRLTQGLRLQYLQKWCEVSRLTPEETTKLQKTFMDSQHVAHVNELASYPMQLAILLHLLYRRQLLPQQRTDLYAEYLKTFLDREQGEDKEPLLADQRRVVEETHAYLGWYLQTKAEEGQSAGSIKRDELRALLQAYLAGRPRAQELADELYSAITDRVLCMVEREDAFEFEVQSLREYFAALHIFENLTPKGNGNSRDDGLNALLERPYWANVCRFFIGNLARGEVRGLSGNFRHVEKRVEPHPLIRSMAVTLLNDRIYDRLTTVEIGEIVDFALGGPGIVFAEDGVLDPAGTPLRLGEDAGRAQAVAHLQSRVLEAPPGSVRSLAEQSLHAHGVAEDDLSGWWWEHFKPTDEWLQTASHLGVLSGLSADRIGRLRDVMDASADLSEWSAELLLNGGYDDNDDPIAHSVVRSLNQGYAETAERLSLGTDAAVLVSCAADVLAGPFVTTQIPAVRTSRLSELAVRVLEGTRALRTDHSRVETDNDWLEYLTAIANIWGDGWVLRRAVSMTPDAVDLALIALRTQNDALTRAGHVEADYRTHKADADWWQEKLKKKTDQTSLALMIIALLTTARSNVIMVLASNLESALANVGPKMFRAIERALHRDAAARRVRPLDLSEALRLQHVSLSGRALWLAWIIGSDSTRERIPARLEPEIRDVFLAGTYDGRAVVNAARSTRKLKLETFFGARFSMPVGGWADPAHLVTMPIKTAQSILESPGEWPADLVQIAVDKLGSRAAARARPLAEVATSNRWFER
ncbi:NACHT domain-containing protein [Cryobacterium fucosi]|uniref:NACHT domain-containing protein n=1 Tax=Cryobacterium fucosi TaxID=1259157 RepID=UPI001F545DC0|nr:HNH endonuclease [Cryobacterium fucosi]